MWTCKIDSIDTKLLLEPLLPQGWPMMFMVIYCGINFRSLTASRRDSKVDTKYIFYHHRSHKNINYGKREHRYEFLNVHGEKAAFSSHLVLLRSILKGGKQSLL